MSGVTFRSRIGVRRGPRLRGLTWLIWRQNRTAFWIGLAAAAAVAVYAAVQHQHITAAVTAQHRRRGPRWPTAPASSVSWSGGPRAARYHCAPARGRAAVDAETRRPARRLAADRKSVV